MSADSTSYIKPAIIFGSPEQAFNLKDETSDINKFSLLQITELTISQCIMMLMLEYVDSTHATDADIES